MNPSVRNGYAGRTLILAASFWCVLTGCKPSAPPGADHVSGSPAERVPSSVTASARQPSVDDLAAFLRASAPAWERIVDVRMDAPVLMPGTAPTSNTWLVSVKFAIVPTEDLLAPATAQDAHAFQETKSELDLLLQVQPPTSQQLLSVMQSKDRPLEPTYGKLVTEWQVDHWRFSNLDVNLPEVGQPRGQFSGSTLVLGSPEAEHLLAAAKATITQVKAKREAVEQSYRADLLKATQPGTLYRGQIRHRGSAIAAEVRFTATPTGADPQREAQLEMSLPGTPGETFIYLARRAEVLPLRLAVSSTAAETGSLSMSELAGALPKGDLTLSLLRTSGKEKAYDDTIPVAMLDIVNHKQQPPVVTLNAQEGRLEGRINGYATDPIGFVLSAQRFP